MPCIWKQHNKMKDYKYTPKSDLTGLVFGRLTVVSFDSLVNGIPKWLVQCRCGNQKSVHAGSLKSGATRSCGCLDAEVKTKHGLYGTPEYHTWEAIKARCHNPRDKGFHRYGGAGILVCDEWLHSFEAFFRDMGKRPSLSHSIDRIDNSLGYSKSNCRWATKREQANNRKTNRILELDGERMSITEWGRKLGISGITIRSRKLSGWSDRDALLTPVKSRSVASQNRVAKMRIVA